MGRPASGEVRWRGRQWTARIMLGGEKRERRTFPLPTCKTKDQADERARLLSDIAARLRTVRCDVSRAAKFIENAAVAKTDAELRSVGIAVDSVVGGAVQLAGVARAPTFREVGERWTSGALAKQYPDQIKAKRTADDDESRLRNHVYPVIGSIPVDKLTLTDCEEVMRRIPETLEVATRRNIGQLITRLMNIAVYPLRLVERSPLPRGFLPAAPKQKALAHLYPGDDARLMACASVPIEHRMLIGFLTREGMRLGEAVLLTWGDLDLERGAVRLDKNKTNDPRAWALSTGVAAALKIYRERFVPNAEHSDRVFTSPSGAPITEAGALGLPMLLRGYLRSIGLDKERPELFASTSERRQLRVHDLRGTFVTVHLANGKSESWIADRTGHKSSQMINRYKRTARLFSEVETGDLVPLDAAIPELKSPANPPSEPNHLKTLASPAGLVTVRSLGNRAKPVHLRAVA